METYAKAKEGFLRSFLDLPNDIPSYDTFNRISITIPIMIPSQHSESVSLRDEQETNAE